jgi:hypothetical protein
MVADVITCVICGDEVKDMLYPEHMAVHGGVGNQINALRQQKEIEQNTPKVIPLSKDAPIDPELAQMIQQMDAPKPEPTPAPEKLKVNTVAGEPKPLKLKYVWEGNCPQDNTPVRTVITKVDGRWFCTAYCISHGELEQTEVTPLLGTIGALETKAKSEPKVEPQPQPSAEEKEVEDERELNVPKKAPRKAKV